ncbi:uncharacterized protein [Nicotiana tomentosiformis]|uniref:uncharacterized protein n=1 Tax=Nicotiana tomentosiformis TaxID=4098 RepID=UPI00388C54CB
MAIATFQNGLSRDGSRATGKLLSRLMKYPLTTWDEIHNAYCAEVRADGDDINGKTQRLTSVQAKFRNELRDNTRSDHPIQRSNMERHQPYIRKAAAPPPAIKKAHPGQGHGITGMKEVKWPPKMRSRPNTGKFDALYEFHQECGHKIEDCIALRQEVVYMLRQGHLKEMLSDKGRTNFAIGREYQGLPKPPSPACTINMIIGGGGDASMNGMKFTTTYMLKQSITRKRYDRLVESIIFDESDADGLTFPHNDALVITLRILDTYVKRIMVDDGSGTCIIHP